MSVLTSRAQNLAGFIDSQGGKYRYEGLFPGGRQIAGTSRLSEHSYGNALDIFGSQKDLESLAKLLDLNRSRWSIKTLCYDGGSLLGGRGLLGYDNCTTKHKDHIHVDFAPNCGRAVPGDGSDSQRVSNCEAYQNGQEGLFQGEGGNVVTSLIPDIGTGIKQGAIVVAGIVLGVAAVAMVLSDMKGNAITSLVKKVAK